MSLKCPPTLRWNWKWEIKNWRKGINIVKLCVAFFFFVASQFSLRERFVVLWNVVLLIFFLGKKVEYVSAKKFTCNNANSQTIAYYEVKVPRQLSKDPEKPPSKIGMRMKSQYLYGKFSHNSWFYFFMFTRRYFVQIFIFFFRFSLDARGKIYDNGLPRPVKYCDGFKEDDIVGCGYCFLTQEVFFTKNGELLGMPFTGNFLLCFVPFFFVC